MKSQYHGRWWVTFNSPQYISGAKQSCSTLLNNWRSWGLVLKWSKTTIKLNKIKKINKMGQSSSYSIIQVSLTPKIPKQFDKTLLTPFIKQKVLLHPVWGGCTSLTTCWGCKKLSIWDLGTWIRLDEPYGVILFIYFILGCFCILKLVSVYSSCLWECCNVVFLWSFVDYKTSSDFQLWTISMRGGDNDRICSLKNKELTKLGWYDVSLPLNSSWWKHPVILQSETLY